MCDNINRGYIDEHELVPRERALERLGLLLLRKLIVPMLGLATMRITIYLIVTISALIYPMLAIADPNLDRFSSNAQEFERSVAAHARVSMGGVTMGDDKAGSMSHVTPFVGLSAQLDFYRVGPFAINTQISFGQLARGAEFGIKDSEDSLWRASYWSSISMGATWSCFSGPWGVIGYTNLGGMVRRYGEAGIESRELASGPMTNFPRIVRPLKERALVISPTLLTGISIGRFVGGQWFIGIELETQTSGLVGGPWFLATATALTATWYWRS